MLNVKRILLPGSFLPAKHHHRFPGCERKSKFVPNVRIVRRNISEANERIPNPLFDRINRDIDAGVLVDAIRLDSCIDNGRCVHIVVAFIELAGIERLDYEASCHVFFSANFEFCGVRNYRNTRTRHFLIIPPRGHPATGCHELLNSVKIRSQVSCVNPRAA